MVLWQTIRYRRKRHKSTQSFESEGEEKLSKRSNLHNFLAHQGEPPATLPMVHIREGASLFVPAHTLL